ncbi:hypothetical protein ACWEQ8_44620 [Streptomyces noursei]
MTTGQGTRGHVPRAGRRYPHPVNEISSVKPTSSRSLPISK